MAKEIVYGKESNILRHDKQDERGVALILALIALLIVTSIGLSVMFMADTETSIDSNFRDTQTAYYASKAGLEEARDRMRTGGTNSISANLPTALPGNAGGVLYITNPTGSETVAPWLATNADFDDEICKEVSCAGGQVPPTSGWYTSQSASTAYATSPVLPYKWARITLKTNASASGWSGSTHNYMYIDGNSANASYYACWNGTNEIAQSTACVLPSLPVYMVTALSVTPSGTRRMLQYEVAENLVTMPSFSGALSLGGASDVFSAASSNGYNIAGSDHAGCGGSATSIVVPAIGVTDSADVTSVKAAIPNNRQTNYTGGSTAPDVENVSSTLSSTFQSVSALQTLIAAIQNNADQVLTGPVTSIASPGTSTSPQVIFVNGDLTLSGNTTGYGILVVTGTFTPGGTVGWNGIVLVVGKGIVAGNGGGNNQYNGAFFVAQTVDSSGNPLTTLGSPTYNWSGGSGNGIYYSSGCIAQASRISHYRLVATREMMY